MIQKMTIVSFATLSLALTGCGSATDSASTSSNDSASSPISEKVEPAPYMTPISGPTNSAQPWVPGDIQPEIKQAIDHSHMMHVSWVNVNSFKEMTKNSDLIVRGHFIARRFDVIRAYAQSKDPGIIPLGLDGQLRHRDMPITLATLQIDSVARTTPGMTTVSGKNVIVGSTIDIVFQGGLMNDGCITEPDDSPLPKNGEEGMYFLSLVGGQVPYGTKSTTGIYSILGGYQGRVSIQQGQVVIQPGQLTDLSPFHGQSVNALSSAVTRNLLSK